MDQEDYRNSVREELHPAIQGTNGFEGSEDLEGAILTGWAVVAEWAAPDGQQYMSYVSADATGERSLPVWRADGMLRYAVDGMTGYHTNQEPE